MTEHIVELEDRHVRMFTEKEAKDWLGERGLALGHAIYREQTSSHYTFLYVLTDGQAKSMVSRGKPFNLLGVREASLIPMEQDDPTERAMTRLLCATYLDSYVLGEGEPILTFSGPQCARRGRHVTSYTCGYGLIVDNIYSLPESFPRGNGNGVQTSVHF